MKFRSVFVSVICLFSLGYCNEPVYAATEAPSIKCWESGVTLKCHFADRYRKTIIEVYRDRSTVYPDMFWENDYTAPVAKSELSRETFRMKGAIVKCEFEDKYRYCVIKSTYKFKAYVISTPFSSFRVTY